MALTQKQIQWASQHDWFIAPLSSGKVAVRDVSWSKDEDTVTETRVVFDDFKKLCRWAGY